MTTQAPRDGDAVDVFELHGHIHKKKTPTHTHTHIHTHTHTQTHKGWVDTSQICWEAYQVAMVHPQ